MKNKISIEDQYSHYLEKSGLFGKIHGIQAVETKRTFYAAFGQAMLVIRDEVSEIEDEDEAVAAMQDVLNQVQSFFQKESNRVN